MLFDAYDGMKHVLAEFNNRFFEEKKLRIYLLEILLLIHIYHDL